MINFNYENEFNLENEDAIASWLSASILSEGKKEEKSIISFVMTNIYTKSILNI
jgi:hypothetical protein